jgi:hypothetical protein
MTTPIDQDYLRDAATSLLLALTPDDRAAAILAAGATGDDTGQDAPSEPPPSQRGANGRAEAARRFTNRSGGADRGRQ